MDYSVVITAAGSGSRMQLGYNKVYYRMDGKTILEHSIETFLKDEDCKQIVVVSDVMQFRKEIPHILQGNVVLCEGGATRQESVCNGVAACMCDVVMIHDGARPFVSMEDISSLKKTMEEEKACCLMVPCKDTIKVVQDGYIEKTLVRDTLRAAQTPQVFNTDLYLQCASKAKMDGFVGTDDCSLVETYSDVRIKVVEGSYENFKITTKEDLK